MSDHAWRNPNSTVAVGVGVFVVGDDVGDGVEIAKVGSCSARQIFFAGILSSSGPLIRYFCAVAVVWIVVP